MINEISDENITVGSFIYHVHLNAAITYNERSMNFFCILVKQFE